MQVGPELEILLRQPDAFSTCLSSKGRTTSRGQMHPQFIDISVILRSCMARLEFEKRSDAQMNRCLVKFVRPSMQQLCFQSLTVHKVRISSSCRFLCLHDAFAWKDPMGEARKLQMPSRHSHTCLQQFNAWVRPCIILHLHHVTHWLGLASCLTLAASGLHQVSLS